MYLFQPPTGPSAFQLRLWPCVPVCGKREAWSLRDLPGAVCVYLQVSWWVVKRDRGAVAAADGRTECFDEQNEAKLQPKQCL